MLASSPPAAARNPPYVVDQQGAAWVAAGDSFVYQTRDRFSVHKAPATVNRLARDGNILWIATDDGVIRFDTIGLLASRLTLDDGLPSDSISSVTADGQFVWFGTNKGLVRYRALDRTLRLYGEEDGLPSAAVNDLVAIGRQVWVATRSGLAMYDADVDGLRSFGEAEGFPSGDVAELIRAGDSLWCRTEVGLTRLTISTRSVSHFSFDDIGGREVRSFTLDGDRIWVGTERGLFFFEVSSDTFLPFPQQAILEGKGIVGVETFTDYVFIVSSEDIVQFHKASRAIRRYTQADGLARTKGATGTVLQGGLLTVMFSDGAEVYDIQRDLWASRSLEPDQSESTESTTRLRLFGTANTELPYDLISDELSVQRFATAEAAVGLGHRFSDGSSLDASLRLDYGQLELPGIRDLQYELEYLGKKADLLREVRASDREELRSLEEGLERTILFQGVHARVATPDDGLQATLDVGMRRGEAVRDFLAGRPEEVYTLSKRHVLPGSETVWVDGERLTAGSDYTLVYPAGQLFFLDPERLDELSVVEVEYEYDLVPKKGLGVLSLLDLLPADREIGDWSLSGAARLISEESGLYQQIDGAAPKYLDRGWVRSVYAEFRQSGRTIQVAIHDLANEANARGLFDFELPPAREPVAKREDVVIDLGLASSYAAKAWMGSYFLELSIDDRSDASKQSLELFSVQILDRGQNAGENFGGAHEFLSSARIALSPVEGLEVGARVVELRARGEPERRLTAGGADLRYESDVEGGRWTAYGELMGSSAEDASGWAAIGRLRLSHPALEGLVSGRHESRNFTPIGTSDRLLGKLRDEARAQATAYPTRWLPMSAFFTREVTADPETGELEATQHAVGRIQLAEERLPRTSVQVGHSLVDTADGELARLRLSAQSEYDFAQGVLGSLGMRRLWIRGLYGVSVADSSETESSEASDRVRQGRIEAKVAPTANEAGYALLRTRTVDRSFGEDFDPLWTRYEVNAGARSTSIPGLVPQLSYTVAFDDDRSDEPFQTSKGNAGGVLSIYPGQWWSSLAALVVEPRYSRAHDERSESAVKKSSSDTHRVDTRLAWATGGTWDFEIYQLLDVIRTGPEDQTQGKKLELRGRLVFRPEHKSPITLRVTHFAQQFRNDVPEAPEWAEEQSDEGALEWLMRWTEAVTSRLKVSYQLSQVNDRMTIDTRRIETFVLHQAGGELELRLFPLESAADLFIALRTRVSRRFGDEDAEDALSYELSGAVIWTLTDMLYLESELGFRKTACFSATCAPATELRPRLYLTVNL